MNEHPCTDNDVSLYLCAWVNQEVSSAYGAARATTHWLVPPRLRTAMLRPKLSLSSPFEVSLSYPFLSLFLSLSLPLILFMANMI